MELAHRDVFETATHQLFAGLENLRPDEAGDVVDVQPGPLRLHLCELQSHRSAEAVFARLEDHHVNAVCGAIGELGALTGLEVEAVPLALLGGRVIQDLFVRDVEDLVAVVCPGEALEHRGNRLGTGLFHLRLDIDVRKHAPGNDLVQVEGVDNIFQCQLDRGDTLNRAVHRIRPNDDVAGRVRKRVEDLPDHVVGMVCRGVRLDATAHIALRAHAGSRQDIEDLLAKHDQLFIAHQLWHAADRVARQPVHDGLYVAFRLVQQKVFQAAHGPVLNPRVLGLVRGLPDQLLQVVFEQRMLVQILDLRVLQEAAGVLPCCLVGSAYSDGRISFLKLIRRANHLLVDCLIEPPLGFSDIPKDVLAGSDLIDGNVCRAAGCAESFAVGGKGAGSSPKYEKLPSG